MLVISSPSGAGKSSIAAGLIASDQIITASVSVTTRVKRSKEINGKDYYFISKDKFQNMKSNDELLEDAFVFNNYYGTPREPVESAIKKGKDILFDIDWQGATQLTKQARDDVVSIFILPPSMKKLSDRLHMRAQDTPEVIAFRMAHAEKEIEHWREYDYVIVNENLEQSINAVQTILQAERLKYSRQIGLNKFVQQLQSE